MKTSTKAVLLSALVCPGAGQVYLRRRVAAALLLTATAAALAALLVPAARAANAIAQRIVSGELTVGPDLVGEVRAASADTMGSATIATAALAATWLVGVVHAWITGKKRDRP